MIPFHPLSREQLSEIVEVQVRQVVDRVLGRGVLEGVVATPGRRWGDRDR